MMFYSTATFTIADYGKWRTVFDNMEGVRQSYGYTGKFVYVNADNPNEVTVVLEWSDETKARQFATSPELRQAMQEAGVQGPPAIRFLKDMT